MFRGALPIRGRLAWLPLAAAVVAAVLATSSAARVGSGFPRVTLIGDSVATALTGDVEAIRTVNRGIDMNLQVAPCLRLVDPSCPPNPPTAVELIKKLGPNLGEAVVLVVGYNEFADHFADSIETTLAALRAANIDHVFWLTLRANRHPYVTMNEQIAAAAAQHPGVSVIDWNVYSRSHPDWFQDDGLHLLGPGAEAMATLIREQLLAAGIAIPDVVVKTKKLADARRGKPYAARLQAGGGRAPYTWSLAGRLPKGLHLRPTGVLWGVTHIRAGPFAFTVKVKDALGQSDKRALVLRLR